MQYGVIHSGAGHFAAEADALAEISMVEQKKGLLAGMFRFSGELSFRALEPSSPNVTSSCQ